MNHPEVDMSHPEVDMSHPEVDMSHPKVVMSQSHYEPLVGCHNLKSAIITDWE